MFLTDIYSNDGEKEEEADQTLQVSDLVSIWYRKQWLQKVSDFHVQKVFWNFFEFLLLIFGPGGDSRVYAGGERSPSCPHCR